MVSVVGRRGKGKGKVGPWKGGIERKMEDSSEKADVMYKYTRGGRKDKEQHNFNSTTDVLGVGAINERVQNIGYTTSGSPLHTSVHLSKFHEQDDVVETDQNNVQNTRQAGMKLLREREEDLDEGVRALL